MTVKDVMVRFSGNASEFKRSAEEVKKELVKLTTEYNNNKRAINSIQKEINTNIKALEKLKKEMELAGGGTEEQKEQYKALEESINEATVRMSKMQVAQTELKQSINDTTEALRRQQESLGNTENAEDDTSEKTEDLSDSFNNFAEVCKSVFKVLSTVSKALIDTTFNAAEMADELSTMSAQTGISVEELQKYKYAQDLIDVSLSDYTDGISKATQVIKKYQSGNSETVLALKHLGVSIYDNNGALKEGNVLFNDIIEALGKVGDNAQQDVYAMTLPYLI